MFFICKMQAEQLDRRDVFLKLGEPQYFENLDCLGVN